MSRYVDGFVLPVPKTKIAEYKKLAETASQVWKEHGALEYVECLAEDVKSGEVTSFPQAVKLQPDETVVFAYAIYKDRAHRDEVNEKVMKDPRMANFDVKTAPFDGMRMFWGGFESFIGL